MKQSKIYRKLLSVALAAVMVLSLTHGMSVGKARAAEDEGGYTLTWEQVENNGKGSRYGKKTAGEVFEENYVDEKGMVRVSIVLLDKSTLSKFPAKNIAANAEAKRYRDSLLAHQEAMAKTISTKVLNGEKLDVVWNITLAANIISANVPYEKVDAIKQVMGVKDVVLETRYDAAAVSKETNDPDMSTASEMVGGNFAWAAGYTGAGSKVAIVDTGLDKDHQSFAADAFEESIKDKDVDLLTEEEVAAAYGMLNAAKFLQSADGIYYSSKVPFAVNYVDKNLDFIHINDKQGEHGSHVAGIAAANRLIPDGNGGYKEALETVKTQGEAPDAQLMIMKVFGTGGGAYDSDYMVAIEDAITLGADAVNLSLGSGNPGLSFNSTYERILNEVAQATNLVWCNSAGNSYSFATYSSHQYLYADDVSFATGGSPGTYSPTFSVASVANKGTTAYSFEAAGNTVFYNETSGYGNEPLSSIAGEYEYILIDGVGTDEEFTALADVLAGKVAFCKRGSTSFYQKANAAVANGAIATVIYNNQAGVINMNLTGYTYTAPAVSITQADGLAIKAGSKKATSASGAEYYTGKITISDTISVSNPGDDFTYEMSDFSSWGVPGDLSLKPEITAPGGNIYSIFGYSKDQNGNVQGGHDQYENMSGTSMASPQVTGLTAVLAQYIRENDLVEKTGRTQRQLLLSLLMSTSEPMLDSYGDYFPVIQQGSGLANVNNAINAKSYITIDTVAETAPRSAASSIAEGKVKVELGEVKGDSFTTTFTLHNFSDEKVSYDLNADFFTQYVLLNPARRYDYRLPDINPLSLAYEWTVDGEAYEPLDNAYDFNGDHVVNGLDAQHLLDYCAGLVEENKFFNKNSADLDKDGDIDTYDARLAFELLNVASVEVDKKDVTVTLKVSGLSNAIKDINGNYIEGYIFAKESDSEDGAIGVTHSIPVLGFYGNWTDASMYDKGSILDYYYGYENRAPYVYGVTGGTTTPYVAGYVIDNKDYFLGNNFADDLSLEDPEGDALYLPERNAFKSSSTVTSVAYTQIRNAAGARFLVVDGEGNVVKEQTWGSSNAAYYYVNGSTWRGSTSSRRLNYSLSGLTEGTQYMLVYALAPEYYLNADGSIRWDDLGDGAYMTLPFVIDNTAPEIVNFAFNEETKEVLVKAKDNQWVACVDMLTEAEEEIDYYGGFKELAKGEEYEYSFDLSEVLKGEEDDPVHFKVEVYDYAGNLTTYKLNLNPEEADDPLTVKIDQTEDEAMMVNGGQLQLTVTVGPWGYLEDDTVTWTSSNTDVLTVDQTGLVKCVTREDASATITATSNQDPTVSDSILVKVIFIRKNLNGIIWDETGSVWVSRFNVTGLPNYQKLNAESLNLALATAAYDEKGTLYTSSLSEWNGTDEHLYTMDTTTWELTDIGTMDASYTDICQAPSLGGNYLIGTYAYYIATVDKTTGESEGAWNLSSVTGDGWFTGAAYWKTDTTVIEAEEEGEEDQEVLADYVFFIDDLGEVYLATFCLVYDEESEENQFWLNDLWTLGSMGEAVDTWYWQSLYCDGSYLYWTRFDQGEDDVDLIMLDPFKTGNVYNMGSFAESVWPVGGLFELGVNPSANAIEDLPLNAEKLSVDAVFQKGDIEKVGRKDREASKKISGSLNAIKAGGETAEPDKISTEVKVDLTAEELTKNGLITLELPETVELLRWNSGAQYKAWNDNEAGKITFAFVDLEGIATDDVILTLVFSKESAGTVTITTSDINEDDKNEVVETLELGFAVHEHVYGEPEWNWAEDYNTATATFVCVLKDDTQVLNAKVTFEDDEVANTRTFTATVEFQGETYTDVKVIPLPTEPFLWKRLGGSNRIETMDLMVNEGFPQDHSAKTILVATALDFKTALLASGLAGALDAPLITILNNATVPLTQVALAQIERLAADGCEVLVLGPTTELSDAVFNAVKEKVANTRRLTSDSGDAETLAMAFYQEAAGKWNSTGTFILATSNDAADALSISPYAYTAKTPIFYTNSSGNLNDEVKAFLTSGEFKRVVITGGIGVVSQDAEDALTAAGIEVVRLFGQHRFLTSMEIARWVLGMKSDAAFQPEVALTADKMGVATGMDYADALASVDVLGRTGGMLLLVSDANNTLKALFEEAVAEFITPNKAKMSAGYIFGGTGAVSQNVEDTLNAAVE